MIDIALTLLRDELQNYMDPAGAVVNVDIDNIGLLETASGASLAKKVIISLVNLEEESTLKNNPAIRKGPGIRMSYENPPVYLNLYVLVTCNYSGVNREYIDALQRLSAVVRFFQSRNSFSYSSMSGGSLPAGSDALDLRFTMELYTLTFEQINHLWGSLGGRQIPFVMYKLRLVALSDRTVLRTAPVIEEIETQLRAI